MFTISSKVLSPRFMGLKKVKVFWVCPISFNLWERHSRKPQVGILKVIYLDFIANHLWGLFPLKYLPLTYFSNASIGSSTCKWCYSRLSDFEVK